MMSMDQIMAGDVMNSLVATLAALAAGLVLSVLLMSNMKRAEAYRLPFTRRRKQHSTVVIFSQACEILESFETFSNLDKDIFGRSR